VQQWTLVTKKSATLFKNGYELNEKNCYLHIGKELWSKNKLWAFKSSSDRIKEKIMYTTWFALVILSFSLYVNFYTLKSLLVHPQQFLIFMAQLKKLSESFVSVIHKLVLKCLLFQFRE